MSERTLKQLVGALVLVVAALVLTTLLSGRGGAPGASSELAGFFEGVSRTTLTSARMTGPQGTVELTRQGDAWMVDGHPPDSGSIARFWMAIESSEVEGLVANNPANHGRMGITEDSAAVLELTVGGQTRTLLMGDQGSRYGTAYVRLPGQDAVYVMDGNLRPHVVRTLDEWRDKRIFAVDTARVQAVEARKGADRYRLVKGDSTWTLEGGGEPTSAAVRDILMELRDFRATGFLAESDSLATLPEESELVALSAEGDTLAALTVGSGSGDRWARARGNETLFEVLGYRADRLIPTRERLQGS